jgi:hypothetical protein
VSDSFSSDEYVLFLGNEVYILVCPAAAWPVTQN